MKKELCLILLALILISTTGAMNAQAQEPNREYYNLSKDQYTPIMFPGNKTPYQQFVIRKDGYTRVDKVINVMYSGQWIILNSTNELVDTKTNNRYRIHSADKGVPLDRILVILNEKGNNIVISSFYPPLPKKVKYVDITNRGGVGDEISPSNGISADESNLKVYKNEKKLPYYKSLSGEVITLDDDFKVE